ncbi:hypothetical protein Plhal304r1_c002g0005311 [Plasmopara halstedii]
MQIMTWDYQGSPSNLIRLFYLIYLLGPPRPCGPHQVDTMFWLSIEMELIQCLLAIHASTTKYCYVAGVLIVAFCVLVRATKFG